MTPRFPVLVIAAGCLAVSCSEEPATGAGAENGSSDMPDAAAPTAPGPPAVARQAFALTDGGMQLGIVEGFESHRWMEAAPPPRIFADAAPIEDEALEEDAGPPRPPRRVRPRVFEDEEDDGGTVMPLSDAPFANATFVTGLGSYEADTGESGERHGPGGVFADLDGDDYPDLVLVTGPGDPVMLYHNVAGAGGAREFDRTQLANQAGGVGATAADYDNDGDLDVYVSNFDAPNVLYRNRSVEDGTLSLEDVTGSTDPTPENPAGDPQHGVGSPRHDERNLQMDMTAAWADVNRDGYVDLYAGTHNGFRGAPDVGLLPGQRDTLFLNNGDGTFTDVTMDAGVPGWEADDGSHSTANQSFASTNAVVFFDMDGDPWPDLLVTNKTLTSDDTESWYRNLGEDENGDWLGFENLTYRMPAGVSEVADLSMGVNVGDYDNDGDMDVAMTDLRDPIVLDNRGTVGGLPDFSPTSCCGAGYSWGILFEDFDRNTLLDLHVSTNRNETDALYMDLDRDFSNDASEMAVAQRRQARGTMVADYDRDGWPDLMVVNLLGSSALYRNQLAHHVDDLDQHRFLAIKLTGDPTLPGDHKSTRDAIGARVYVTVDSTGNGDFITMRRDVQSGGSNAASTGSFWQRFGLGRAPTAAVTIQWPSGRMTTLTNVPANSDLRVTETDE